MMIINSASVQLFNYVDNWTLWTHWTLLC